MKSKIEKILVGVALLIAISCNATGASESMSRVEKADPVEIDQLWRLNEFTSLNTKDYGYLLRVWSFNGPLNFDPKDDFAAESIAIIGGPRDMEPIGFMISIRKGTRVKSVRNAARSDDFLFKIIIVERDCEACAEEEIILTEINGDVYLNDENISKNW